MGRSVLGPLLETSESSGWAAEKPADVGFLLDKDGKVLYIKALVAER